MARRPVLGATLIAPLFVATAAAVEITGNVTTQSGAPISGAVVSIISARSLAGGHANRAGALQSGRQAVTDVSGAYKLGNLQAEVELTLSVEAKDYCPRLRSVTVDSSRHVSFTLPAKSAAPEGSQFQFAGRVLRPDGKPAAGAVISRQKDEPRVVRARNRVIGLAAPPGAFANAQEFEPWTKTDEEGNFFILTATPAAELAVTADAEGAVKGQVFQLWSGQKTNTCNLIVGATISGRVLKDARPVEGVTVGLALGSPTGERPGAIYQATGDREGRFVIEHVPPERGCLVFTKMDSLAEANLAAIKQEIFTGRDRQVTEMAELNLHPAHEVRGRIVFSEPPPLMPQVDVVLSRTGVNDRQRVRSNERGEFAFNGVPSESVALSFQEFGMSGVVGYRLSAQHRSLDHTRLMSLCGRVDEDLDLLVLFEPGEAPVPLPQTVDGRIVRMVIQQPGGGRRIVQMPAAQMQRDVILNHHLALPLRGIEPGNSRQ